MVDSTHFAAGAARACALQGTSDHRVRSAAVSLYQSYADGCGELRREGFADTVVFHPFVTRLEERCACRIAVGDLEECLCGAERRDGCHGVVS